MDFLETFKTFWAGNATLTGLVSTVWFGHCPTDEDFYATVNVTNETPLDHATGGGVVDAITIRLAFYSPDHDTAYNARTTANSELDMQDLSGTGEVILQRSGGGRQQFDDGMWSVFYDYTYLYQNNYTYTYEG